MNMWEQNNQRQVERNLCSSDGHERTFVDVEHKLKDWRGIDGDMVRVAGAQAWRGSA